MSTNAPIQHRGVLLSLAGFLVSVFGEARAESTVRLVAEDAFTFHVVVRADRPFRGGEFGLRFPGGVFVFDRVEAGEAFGNRGAEVRIHRDPAPSSACPADPALTASLIVGWINPANQNGTETLSGGADQRVLTLHFRAGPNAAATPCAPLRFVDCLGHALAPIQNILTDSIGRSFPLVTRDATSCQSACRLLRFAPAQRAACEKLVVELRELSGTSINRREIVSSGLNGFDVARKLFDDYRTTPVAGFTFAAIASGIAICRPGGAPFEIAVDSVGRLGLPEPADGAPLRIGEPAGACGIDVTLDPPTCPDRDGDGACDADDCQPDTFNAEQGACPSAGFCRLVKFDPLCAFKCVGLTFELTEPTPLDNPTPIPNSRRTVAIEGDGTGLDVAVEFCRAYGTTPPTGFTAHGATSGCTLCRTNGAAFRIFLDPDDAGPFPRQEITVGRVTSACGLRVWIQPPGCPDTDADGVCNDVDRCPETFDPSQADLDGDCVNDACQTGTRPAVPADLCTRTTLVAVAAGGAAEPKATLTPCERAACFRFTAPVGKPVILTLTDTNTTQENLLWFQWDREASPIDAFAAATRRGSSAQRLVIPQARNATGFVFVESPARSAESTITLKLEARNVALDRIAPNRGAPGTRVSVAIRGVGFEPATKFALVPPGGAAPIPLTAIQVIDGTRAEGVVVIPGTAVVDDLYDLAASTSDVPFPTLEDAFRIIELSEVTGLEVSLFFGDFYRTRFISRGTLRLRNRTSKEIVAPLLEISTRFTDSSDPRDPTGPTQTNLTLRGESIDLYDPFLERRTMVVVGAGSDGIPGRIGPGAEIDIPIVFRNVDPSCLFCFTTFEARILTALPSDAVGWEALPKPEGLTADQWRNLWPRLSTRLGSTWNQVQASFADLATRIGRRGVPATSARELFRFAAREALGLPVAAAAGQLLAAETLEPLSGVVVVALEKNELVSFAETDGAGRFAVDWLENGKKYRLEANGRAGGLEITLPQTGDLTSIPLELFGGGARHEPVCRPCQGVALPEDSVFPPREFLTKAAEARTTIVGSYDPNEKDGPEGLGSQGLVGSGAEFVYVIYFENKATAGASARTVEITDVLDDSFDLNTVRFLDAYVAGKLVNLDQEAARLDNPSTDTIGQGSLTATAVTVRQPLVHLDDAAQRPTKPIDYTLHAELDRYSRTITWTFETVDRVTGTTGAVEEAPRDGFLPPNDPRPHGEGWVSFSVKLRPGLDDDDPVSNSAQIRFDDNAAIVTPAVVNTHSLFLPANQARNPRPAVSEDPVVPLDVTLAWEHTRRAEKWSVRLWKVSGDGARTELALPVPGLYSQPFARAPKLEHDTDYEWQVDALNIKEHVTQGETWRFRTVPPPVPCPPAPANLLVTPGGCDPAEKPTVLTWERSQGGNLKPTDAIFYAVFIGTLEASLELVADGITSTRFEVPDLPPGTHLWRVVAMTESCSTLETGTKSALGPPFEGCVGFQRGDSDANRAIELTDAVQLLNYLFLGAVKPACLEAADFDDNGDADISDAIANLNYQFLGGPPPAAPGPEVCGLDVNEESPDLGCDVSCQ